MYEKYCTEKNEKPYQFKQFNIIMNNMNIRLFKPRKNQCDIYISHINGNISDDEWNEHIARKEAARSQKEKAKTDPNLKYVFVVDVEAVMVCPRAQASAFYYRIKLQVRP